MKIAGYSITGIHKTIIISTAAENGFSNDLMISVVYAGELVCQEVLTKQTAANSIELINKYKSGYHWVSRLSVVRINAYAGVAVVGRNNKGTLFPMK